MWAVHSSIFCCVYEFLNRLTLTHLYKRLMKIQRPILIQISQVSKKCLFHEMKILLNLNKYFISFTNFPPVSIAVWSKVRFVLYRLKTEIVSSNPAGSKDVYLRLSVFCSV